MQRLKWTLPLALFAIFFWRTPYTMRSLPLSVLDWAVPVAVLGTWAVVRWQRKAPWPRTSLDWPLLAWCLVTTAAAVSSVNLRGSLQGAWEVWGWALILGLMVDALRRGWGPVLWRAVYLAGGVVCLLAALEFLSWYFGWPLLPTFQQGWLSLGGLAHLLPPTLYRLSFTLVYPTVLSAFTALLIPPAICFLLATRDRSVRWGLLLWLVAAGVIEILSLSRGGFLAMGISLPFVLLGTTRSPGFRRWWSQPSHRTLKTILAGATIVALVLAVIAGAVLVTRLASHRSGDAVRMDLWQSAAQMLRDHPFTGVGPTAFGTALRAYRNPLLARDQVNTAHDLYLNIGAETGVVGLGVGLWLLLTLAHAWWRRWREEPAGTASWWRLLGSGGALAGLVAQSSVETFSEPAILFVGVFFTAQILALGPPHRAASGRSKRWLWLVVLAVLAVGALGLAWDDRGYAHFLESVAWTRQGSVEQALPAVRRAQQDDAGMPLYACHAGYLYGLQAAQDDAQALNAALQQYQKCMRYAYVPGWLDQLNASALLWQTGRTAEARAAVGEATANTPLEWMPWLNTGLWAETIGERDEAIHAYGWVLSLDPELAGSPFWRQGERSAWWQEVLAAGEEARAERGEHNRSWRWQVELAAGDWEEAEQEIATWLETHPEDAEAMAWLGEALVDLDRPAEALVWLDLAIARVPSRARTYVARGEAATILGRYDEADRNLRTALFLEPSYRAHLGLARLARTRADDETAAQEYARALRPFVLSQPSDQILYRRMSWPALLPQAARIGYRQDREAALEWGALLEQRGKPEIAQQVYAASLLLDQFQGDVRRKLAAAQLP